MRILVVGASQGLGKETTKKALAEGHRVTAFARHPEGVGISHERLRLVRGDVTSIKDVTKAMKNQQAVIITLGLPTKQAMGFGHSLVLSGGTANVIEAMDRAKVKRLILETAIGAGDSKHQLGWFYRLTLRVGLHHAFREKDSQESLAKASSLDWTIVRPSALTNGLPTGSYLVNPPMSYGMFTHIARKDVATFLVGCTEDATTIGKELTVTYPRSGFWRDFPRWLKDYKGRT
ncbi:NAD(P)-dependent oxidoreductase [Patescibacteria group bacterium]|nr:NAD(P)-dependent oxidoreductase [Patescibacteria group bacterium]